MSSLSRPVLVILMSSAVVMVQVTLPHPATPHVPADGEVPFTPPMTPGDVVPGLPDIPGAIFGFPGRGSGFCGLRSAACKAGCRSKRGFGRLVCSGLCAIECKGTMSDEVLSCTQKCSFSVSPTLFSDTDEVMSHIDSCYQSCKN